MEHLFYIGTLMCVWIIVSLGANLVIGYTGLMAMGQAAYMGIGAYTAAVLNIFFHVPFPLAVLAAAIVSGVVAAATLVPLLRLEGFYFALATLGMNFLFFDLFHNLAPRVEGSEGLYGLNLPDFMAGPRGLFLSVALITCVCVFLCWRLDVSPYGRALRATRDKPDALRTLGKEPKRFQISVWGVGGALSGVGGAFYAAALFYVDPTLFTLNASIAILVFIGVGGLASLFGSVLGPILLVGFTEGLRFVGLPSTLTGPLQSALYGLLLILLMMFRRQGLVGKHDFKD
jgi:branched-chain amino acid transport system permease protein